MAPSKVLRALAAAALAGCVVFGAGCGAGQNVSPTSSNEEVGTVQLPAAPNSSAYTVRSGDTLRKIAARPDIYGDADLWPLIAHANRHVLGNSLHVKPGMQLIIPQDATAEEKAAARDEARRNLEAVKAHAGRAPVEAAAKAATQEASAAVTVPTPAPTAQAAAAPPASRVPVKAPGGGSLVPILLILFLVLLIAAGVTLYILRKDRKEE